MIRFEEGNILDEKYTMICHQVNTKGIMGAGLALQLKNKYPDLYIQYKMFCEKYPEWELIGQAQVVVVNNRPARQFEDPDLSNKLVWNLFAQKDIGTDSRKTNYFWLDYAFRSIVMCKMRGGWQYQNTLAIPYGIGCGLAGGDWDGVVYPMIQNIFKDASFEVVIVKYNGSK